MIARTADMTPRLTMTLHIFPLPSLPAAWLNGTAPAETDGAETKERPLVCLASFRLKNLKALFHADGKTSRYNRKIDHARMPAGVVPRSELMTTSKIEAPRKIGPRKSHAFSPPSYRWFRSQKTINPLGEVISKIFGFIQIPLQVVSCRFLSLSEKTRRPNA
jgi:hypothetical protein